MMALVTLAILIAENRGTDRRLRYLTIAAVSLTVFFCAGWFVARAPGFSCWVDGWRYIAVMYGIASIACVAGSVSIVRKSIVAFMAALVFVALSYVVIYRAVDLFAMMDR